MGSANNSLDQRQNSDKEVAKQLRKSPLRGPESGEIQMTNLPEDDPQSPNRLSDESKSRLQDWDIERKEARETVELYRNRCTSDKTELYQLLAFYSVFQGVVFNTVATSNWLTCQTSLLPAMLSTLAFVATAVSVHYKLTDYEKDKRKLINSEHLAEYARDRMTLLKDNGDEWDFKTYCPNKAKLERNLKQDKRSRRKFYWIVMSFLFVFSVTILACCIVIRCWEQKEGTFSLCAFTVCWDKHNVTVTRHKLF